MQNLKQHAVSFAVVVVFALLAMASSSKVNKLHLGAFTYTNAVEDESKDDSYLELNDGTKVHGSKITWHSGILQKKEIKVDDRKFTIAEVRGYRSGATYYGRLRNEYIRRIVHGKINVYVLFTPVTTPHTDATGYTTYSTRTRTDHYAQVGEDAPLLPFANQEDIKQLVADCPLAHQMADVSNSGMRKAIRKNRNYLNSIFDTYNNGCRVTEK